jgi:hypothetical protein
MCCLSKPIPTSEDVPEPIVDPVMPDKETKTKNQNYNTIGDRLRHLTNFYDAKLLTDFKLSIRVYSRDHQLPRSTFQFHLAGLEVAKKLKEKMPVAQFRSAATTYLENVETNLKVRTGSASVSNRYLTDNEERQFILFCTIMCEVGYGISKPELKILIDDYVDADAILQEMEESSTKIIDNVLKRNPGFAKFLKAGALDPKRARQATEKTRSNFFKKMDCFIKLLYEQGAVPWKCFGAIPSSKIYNMDEVGFDFTGHRLKVLTPTLVQKRRLANQQCTPDGDGKMKQHITGCVTTCANGTDDCRVLVVAYFVVVDFVVVLCRAEPNLDSWTSGLYRNTKKNINEGAPSLFTIHSDKTCTKEKEKAEREKQRAGLAPSSKKIASRFTKGLEDSDIVVTTSSSGSQLQETFTLYSKHLVTSLGPDHGPAILVMDGHASRWTAAGLRYLLANRIFPCFLPSHTSMWSQPNDCNLNRRLHECMEKAALKFRRTDSAPTLATYNSIMKEGWQLLIDEEDTKLNSFLRNTTTQSWEDCGLSPFNPYCLNWNEAIASFGQLEGELEQAFEIEPVERRDKSNDEHDPTNILDVTQKAMLRNGIPVQKLKGMNDFSVAVIRGREILLKWRNDVKKTVGEGESVDNACTSNVPTATTEPQMVAMLLLRFVPVDLSTIKTGEMLSKEERQKEADVMTLKTTEVMQSLKLIFWDENGTPQPAASMKLNSLNDKNEQMWSVSINGLDPKRIPESDLLATYQIISAYQDPANIGILRNGRARLHKRTRLEKAKLDEKERNKKAVEKQDAAMFEDFNTINMAINSGRFEFVMFKEILEKWKKPFQCQVEGVECLVGSVESAILQMKPAMIRELSGTVLAKRATDNNGDTSRPAKKRRNNAAVPTGFGEQGQTASYLVQSRDYEEKERKDASVFKSKQKRKDAVKKTLCEYDGFQEQFRLELKKWQEQQDIEVREKNIENNSNEEESSQKNKNNNSSNNKKKRSVAKPTELWEVSEKSRVADLDLLAKVLRLDGYKFAANKSTKILWIPRDKLNCNDVLHGYFCLQKEYKELDGFLSNANQIPLGVNESLSNATQIPLGVEESNVQTENDVCLE